MEALIAELKKMGIRTVILPMKARGCYLPDLRIIFLKEDQPEEEMKATAYHELAHGLRHTEFKALYGKFPYHSKMEAEANDYMVTRLIEESGGYYNYSQVIENFKLGMGHDTKYCQ